MNLFLFTKSFPFGKGETFLESEINVLSNNFKEVHIFPWDRELIQRKIPSNCIIHSLTFNETKGLKSIIINNLFLLVRTILLDIKSNINRKALLRPKAYFNDLIRALFEGQELKRYINKNFNDTNALLYTYWFSHWTVLLSFIKEKNQSLVTRSHGYDFNLERNNIGYFPFRPIAYKKISCNYNVSSFGSNYLKRIHHSEKEKIRVSYLGVQNQSILSKHRSNVLVSCSNVISLKRNALIVDVLKEMTEEIHWVHFGEGELLNDLKIKCKELPSNIKVTLKGHLKNSEIIEWYKNNEYNSFIHLSESEGLPVSMMEAQSFGMPIIACKVGGVGEIVNEVTGYLLPKNFTIDEAINGIKKVMKFSQEKRINIQKEQQKTFSAEKNFNDFAIEIKKI